MREMGVARGAARGQPRASARVRGAALLAPRLVLALGSTLRYEVRGVDRLREARESSPDGRVIFCCWHGRLLPLVLLVRGRGMRILVSRHRDGEILARVTERLGFRPIRGSTRRGGARALLEALRAGGGADLALTPDGPRGPRERFGQGAVFLASRSGLPLVPVGCAARPAWQLRSWDAFQVPRPFARVRVVCGAPVMVPSRADAALRERLRRDAEGELASASREAEAWERP
jgi:lysophospholipid acyltransferase (LPLAT)-like uncharacterized protein